MNEHLQHRLTNDIVKRMYEAGLWEGEVIAEILEDNFIKSPSKIAIVDKDKTCTYRELDEKSKSLASSLYHKGIRSRDVVCVMLPNKMEFIVAVCALFRMGCIVTPIPTHNRFSEVKDILSRTQAKAIFLPSYNYKKFDYIEMVEQIISSTTHYLRMVVEVGEPQRLSSSDSNVPFYHYEELLEEKFDRKAIWPEVSILPDEVAVIFFTSGTEGKSKGVMHTSNTLLCGCKLIIEKSRHTENDVFFIPSPMTHASGFHGNMLCGLHVGAKIVLLDIWVPTEAIQLIEKEKCTYTQAATPFLKDITHSPILEQHDVSSMRIFVCGGAPIPRELVKEAKQKIGCAVVGLYGSSEVLAATACSEFDDIDKVVNTDGKPLKYNEIRIETALEREDGAGEILIKGPQVFIGYFKDFQRTMESFDGEWFRSGDLGIIDEDGYLKVVDRIKDVIIRGGINISVKEIEDILYLHPKISEIAIVATPDERLGEKSCAYIIPKSGVESVTLEEITSFLEERYVDKYKWPEKIQVVKELPRTPSGKIQKFILRKHEFENN